MTSPDPRFRSKAPTPFDSGWITFPFALNYQGFGSGYQAPQYRKIGDLVYLRGTISRNTASAGPGSVAGTLPTGYRPLATALFEQGGAGTRARVDVESDGEVKHIDITLTVGGFLSFDGIVFSTV